MVIFKPFNDKILVEILEEKKEETTPGGVVLPENVVKIGPVKARVLAVGPGTAPGPHHKPMESKVGDLVLLDRDATYHERNKVVVNGRDQVVVWEGHVLGKIVEE